MIVTVELIRTHTLLNVLFYSPLIKKGYYLINQTYILN